MNSPKRSPSYPRRQSAALICASYKNSGSAVVVDALLESVVEREVGKLSDGWNIGLFRFLDESLYLLKILCYYSTALSIKDRSLSLTVLLHQIERNLLAIRTLGVSGLDGPARQNLRVLYEMCHAFCRALVDLEFRQEFSRQPNFESANKFWHKFISKQKTEQYLREYNTANDHKCFLVEGGFLGPAHEVLGVGAHPNYLIWAFDLERSFTDVEKFDRMFAADPKHASELVLSTSCQLSLLTIGFSAPFISQAMGKDTLGLLAENILFKHHEAEQEALSSMSKIATMMVLMLAKLLNRNSPDFDPAVHL